MKIRSITCFFDPHGRASSQTLDRMGRLRAEASSLYTKAGYDVQTTRLATAPFPTLYATDEIDSAVQLAQTLESDAKERGFDYISLGPALPDFPGSYEMVIPILQATQDVFLGGKMTTRGGDISLKAVRACAQIITRAASVTPDGFTNLRFGALANVPAHAPFFPAAYHEGERPAFALAMECADVAYSEIRKARTLAEARENILETLESEGVKLASTGNHLAQEFDADFRGIDFSLAPFPEVWCSLGASLEALGLPALGMSGSLAAAAFLADTLDRGSWTKTGFNGMMMPVLEDSQLAARSAEGTFGVHHLLMYSAVCGTGLDTVPLPGDASAEQIAALLLDVAALALRLNKPLTARLMPLPGKKAGDPAVFDFAYFAPGKVMDLPAAPLKGLLAGEEEVSIRARGRF
ncbi:MAG: DUF711 family protein [Chloroflexi bacterium]|nr:DUF711 family protein [Chloroflexota bacterium]